MKINKQNKKNFMYGSINKMRAFLSEFVLTKMKNMHKLQVEGRSQENTTLWELSLTKIEKWATKPYHNLVIRFINLFPPGSSEEDPGSLQNYLPNICHDLRQMIQIGDTEKTGCVRHGEMH